MVMGLTSVNMIVLVTWKVFHPMTVKTYNLPPEIRDWEDYELRKDYHVCESEYEMYYTGTLFGIQGILMLLGAFLAWETRKVKIEALNDSKLIGVCIYNVVVLSILGVTVSLAMDTNIDLSYSLDSGVILVATTVTQCLIFIPKIMAYRQYKINPDAEPGTKMAIGNTMDKHATMTQSSATTAQVSALEQQLKQVNATLREVQEENRLLKESYRRLENECKSDQTGKTIMPSDVYVGPDSATNTTLLEVPHS